MNSVKWQRTALLAVALAAASAPWAQAQRPGAGGRPPGGGMPPGMGKPFQAMRPWGDKHRNLRTLGRTVRGLGELDRDPATQLTAAQAKQILPILKAWRHKPAMTDAQAAKINHQITAVLKPAQVKKLTARRGPGGRPPGGFGRPPGGGPPPHGAGGGRPGGFGGPPPGGGRFGGPPPMPKEFNPLNPDTSPFIRDRARRVKGYDSMIAALAARAK